jgi:hypothetical protein
MVESFQGFQVEKTTVLGRNLCPTSSPAQRVKRVLVPVELN